MNESDNIRNLKLQDTGFYGANYVVFRIDSFAKRVYLKGEVR